MVGSIAAKRGGAVKPDAGEFAAIAGTRRSEKRL
jgi:hypothetical protein